MQTMLLQRRDPQVRTYFIWGPYLTGDTIETARQGTQRFLAPNSVYFWTSTQKLSAELASVLRLGMGRAAWDVYLIYRKGIIWEGQVPSPTYWQQQLEVLQGEPFNITVFEGRILEYLRP